MHRWPSFIVTTANDVRLLTGDSESVVHSGNGLYYGLSWCADNIYILGRNGVRKPGHPDVFVLDKDFNTTGCLPGEFADGHQIHCDGERLYTTNTANNAIGVVDLKTNTTFEHNWTNYKVDKNHINSVWKDENYFWVGYHQWFRPKDKGKFEVGSKVVKISSDFSSVLEEHTVGYGNHNVVRVGNELFICSSGNHEFVVYNLESRDVSRKVDTGYWVRGIGITDKYIVLGATSISGDREGRLTGDSEVYLLDRETLVTIDKKILKNTGSIYELRLVGCDDYAHNKISFPGIIG